ncbi:MAG TPA: efflux RND transporter permease subunit [Kofleriaceae bacterium]|nr:efflux RND transporter permease subunit [Kofleriaceae bacterium]
MFISDYAIKKPITTVVVMLALVVFGAVALILLDTDEYPEVNPPVVAISIPYPGASPSTVERELITPLEESFSAISGVDEMHSTSTDGFGNIIVIFNFEKDLQQASQDIRDKISEVRNDLPPEMEEPILTRFDPQDLPIVSLTLSSTKLSPADLTRLADPGMTGDLRGIPGVADVTVVGGIERELTVELRPDALQAASVSVGQVVAALQSENLAAPVGRLTGSLDERTIRLRGRLAGPSDFEQLVITQRDGKLIRLGDVARVRDGTEEARSVAFYRDRPAVGIDIKKTTNESTTAVAERVRKKLDELRPTLPAGVTLDIVRDAGTRVEASVEDVETSLLLGALLTVLVVYVFLMSWRSTVITGLALPVSVLASFIAVWGFGFTLNTMSLLGLSLAIGILIDDAIVVRENIVRHMEMGKDHVTAAREGTSEIGLAVAATTFSIIVVFVPIAFMGGIAQQWLGPFALTIAASVAVSLFVSFSLDPMLSAAWPDPELEADNRNWVSRRFVRFNHWLERQTERYRHIIGWALRHRIAMVALAIAAFVGALALPATGLVGSGFFPTTDDSEFQVNLEMPAGSNLVYSQRKALAVAKLAARYPEVAYTYTTVGKEGNIVDEAIVFVRLVPKKERDRSQQEISTSLRAEARKLGGLQASIASGFGDQKQIQVQVTGRDLAVLALLADRVAKEVEQTPGAVDVGLSSKGQKSELDVVLDRDLAGSLGVTLAEVAQSLRPAFAGIDAGDWIDPQGETRDVEVRLSPESRTRPQDLESLPIVVEGQGPTPTTSVVPLGQIAEVRENRGPVQINHLDRHRVITVGANTEGVPLSAVIGPMGKRLEKVSLPPGYKIEQGGETEDQAEVFGRMLISLGVAVLLMYLILVVQFGSFLDPIPIMASLPLSLIGVMLALLITDSTINLMSMIGVILLMGIVAKNAILLIDFAKHSERQGMDRKTAIAEAGAVRLRPILMTSFAVIAGMLPVAIGGGEGAEWRAPLGRAVIGGVITSTMLTLLVIPTFYDILASTREWFGRRFHRRRPHHTAPPP